MEKEQDTLSKINSEMAEMCHSFFQDCYYSTPPQLRSSRNIIVLAPKYFIENIIYYCNSVYRLSTNYNNSIHIDNPIMVNGCKIIEHPKNELCFFISGAIEPDDNCIMSVRIP